MAIGAEQFEVDAFLATDEHDALRETVRRYAEKHWPESHVRASMEAGELKDPANWDRLAQEIGVFGLGIPGELGGYDGGMAELAIVAGELGRNLVCLPFVSTASSSLTLVASEDEAALEELVPQVAAGELAMALVGTDTRGAWMPAQLSVTAEASDGHWFLSGTAAHVVDGMQADALVVLAESVDGAGLFLVGSHDVGPVRRPMPALDLTRGIAEIAFSQTRATRIGELGAGRALMEYGGRAASVLLAAEQLGAAKAMLDTSVSHAKFRNQFGRPIGSFQSIKHQLVELSIQFETALSMTQYAAHAFDRDPSTPMVSQARILAADAFESITAKSIQIHGGLGFTWEHAAHLYFKRAVSSASLWGGRAAHREQLLATLDTLS